MSRFWDVVCSNRQRALFLCLCALSTCFGDAVASVKFTMPRNGVESRRLILSQDSMKVINSYYETRVEIIDSSQFALVRETGVSEALELGSNTVFVPVSKFELISRSAMQYEIVSHEEKQSDIAFETKGEDCFQEDGNDYEYCSRCEPSENYPQGTKIGCGLFREGFAKWRYYLPYTETHSYSWLYLDFYGHGGGFPDNGPTIRLLNWSTSPQQWDEVWINVGTGEAAYTIEITNPTTGVYISPNYHNVLYGIYASAVDCSHVRDLECCYEYSSSTPPQVTVVSPNGGESWPAGVTKRISWQLEGGGSKTIQIYLSHNSGSSWTKLADYNSSSSTFFDWKVTGPASNNCKIKVRAIGTGGSAEDVSNSVFSILQPNVPPTLSLIQPAATIDVTQGDEVTISWQDSDPDDNAQVQIAYDFDCSPGEHTFIGTPIQEDLDGNGDLLHWNTSGVPAGSYRIWGLISDGINNPVSSCALGTVRVGTRKLDVSILPNINQELYFCGQEFTWDVWVKSNGSPVPDAAVELLFSGGPQKYGIVHTNSNGYAQVSLVSDDAICMYVFANYGDVRVTVNKAGFSQVRRFLHIEPGPAELCSSNDLLYPVENSTIAVYSFCQSNPGQDIMPRFVDNSGNAFHLYHGISSEPYTLGAQIDSDGHKGSCVKFVESPFGWGAQYSSTHSAELSLDGFLIEFYVRSQFQVGESGQSISVGIGDNAAVGLLEDCIFAVIAGVTIFPENGSDICTDAIPDNDWHQIRLNFDGELFTVLVDSNTVLETGFPEGVDFDESIAGPVLISSTGGYEIDDVRISAENASVPITPVVLVHGWRSNLEAEPDLWADMQRWLHNDGFRYVWTVDLEECGTLDEILFPIDPKRMFRGNARILSEFIENKIGELDPSIRNRVNEVDIVAHSMGGLVARRYLSQKHGDQWDARLVRNLIMLGTPNMGSSLAYFSERLCPSGPAWAELSPLAMKTFNGTYSDNAQETRFHVAWGTAGLLYTPPSSYKANLGCYGGLGLLLGYPNDGLVEKSSALRERSDGTIEYASNYGQLLCHDELRSSRDLYESFILPTLRGAEPRPIASSFDPAEQFDAQYCVDVNGHAKQGESPIGSFPVQLGTTLAIYVFASDSTATLSLISPSGLQFDSSSTSFDSTVTALSGSMGIQGFVLADAEFGNWQWRINSSNDTSSEFDFTIVATCANSVTVEAHQSLDYVAMGDSLTLWLEVADGGQGVTGLEVTTVPIWNGVDTASSFVLHDDGTNSDVQAGDGIYSAQLSHLLPGAVEFKCLVVGPTSIGEISRFADLSAYVLPGGCGDCDYSGQVDITDAVYLINYIFAGGSTPMDESFGDFNCSARTDITDCVYLINYIFAGGAAPCEACP